MNAKVSAEFARLFDFFTKLASVERRKDLSPDDESVEESSADERTQSHVEARSSLYSPSSSSSHSVELDLSPPISPIDDTPDHPPSSTHLQQPTQTQAFPLQDDPGFTFKMMLHDLYSIADFATMVKDALAASREMFRPLATDTTSTPLERSSWRVCAKRDRSSDREEPRGDGEGMDAKGEVEVDRPAKKRCVEDRQEMGSEDGGILCTARIPAERREGLTIDTTMANENPSTTGVARTSPMATTTSPTGLGRPRANSSPRKRAASQANRRSAILTPAIESPVVKKAEAWLSSPKRRSWMVTSRPIRIDEGFVHPTPDSAPSTQTEFDLRPNRYSIEAIATPKRKRRLST